MRTTQENLAVEVNLREIAESVFMSVSHFSHTFKRPIGESPKSFLIKERIEKAKKYLTETSEYASEIASILGYVNVYSYTDNSGKKPIMTVKGCRNKFGKHKSKKEQLYEQRKM